MKCIRLLKIASIASICVVACTTAAHAGIIGGAAAIITGASSIASVIVGTAITVGVSLVASKLFGKKPQKPTFKGASILPEERKFTTKNPVNDRTLLYGRARTFGNLAFHETNNNNRNYIQVKTVSEGECEGPESVYVNSDTPVLSIPTEGNVATSNAGTYSGHFSYGWRSGDTSQSVMSYLDTNLTSAWGTNHRLRGIAYDVVNFKLKSDLYEGGTPQHSTVWKGIKCYDPRSATTAWTENPVLIARDYILRTTPSIVAGDFDVTSWNAAANICDETVVVQTTGTGATTFTAVNSTFDSLNNESGTSFSASADIDYNETSAKLAYIPISVTSGQTYSLQFYANRQLAKSRSTSTLATQSLSGGLKNPSATSSNIYLAGLESAYNVNISSTTGLTGDIYANKTIYDGVQSLSFTAAATGTYYIGFVVSGWSLSSQGTLGTSGSQTIYLDVSQLTGIDATGSTEKRYTCNGTIKLDSENAASKLEDILATCNGRIFSYQGKLHIYVGSYSTPTETITEDDIRGSVEIINNETDNESFNTIKGLFVDPNNDWQLTDYPAVSHAFLLDRDGFEQAYQLDLSMVTSKSQARRLAYQHLKQQRQGLRVKLSVGFRLYDLVPTDFVNITLPHLGWDEKVFFLEDMEIDFTQAKLNLTLIESSPIIFDYEYIDDQAVDSAPNTNLGLVLDGSPANIYTVPTLPLNADGTHGDVIMVQADNKVYRHDGTAWLSTTSADDLTGGTIDNASIVMDASSIESNNYSSGLSGWKVSDTTSEFNDVVIRGSLSNSGSFFNNSISGSETFDGTVMGYKETGLGAFFSASGPWYSDTLTFYGPTSSDVNATDKNRIGGRQDALLYFGIACPYDTANNAGGVRRDPYYSPPATGYIVLDAQIEVRVDGGSWSTPSGWKFMDGTAGAWGVSGPAGTFQQAAVIHSYYYYQNPAHYQFSANLGMVENNESSTFEFRLKVTDIYKSSTSSSLAWNTSCYFGMKIVNNGTSADG